MMIIERYILKNLLRTFGLSILVLVFLFLVFDAFDRIDTIIREGATIWQAFLYFILKIPNIFCLMLPVAGLISTVLSIGMLSKHAELTVMRASGVTLWRLARPLFSVGLVISLFSLALREFVVPVALNRSQDIFNVEIRKKTERGSYNSSNLWWRSGNSIYSGAVFDSRSSSILGFDLFELDPNTFTPVTRTSSQELSFVSPDLGWSMRDVTQYWFQSSGKFVQAKRQSLSLPIRETPQDFYNVKTDPDTMSWREMHAYLKSQKRSGVSTGALRADLHEKLSFPFANFVLPFAALGLAVLPSRTGSIAKSIVAAMALGFSFYIVHSLSLALGRAEILPPVLSAWLSIGILGAIGLVLTAGAEAPRA